MNLHSIFHLQQGISRLACKVKIENFPKEFKNLNIHSKKIISLFTRIRLHYLFNNFIPIKNFFLIH